MFLLVLAIYWQIAVSTRTLISKSPPKWIHESKLDVRWEAEKLNRSKPQIATTNSCETLNFPMPNLKNVQSGAFRSVPQLSCLLSHVGFCLRLIFPFVCQHAFSHLLFSLALVQVPHRFFSLLLFGSWRKIWFSDGPKRRSIKHTTKYCCALWNKRLREEKKKTLLEN